jgi:hypothetical protein
MERKLSFEDILQAADLKSQGLKLWEIIGLLSLPVSIMTLSRAIRDAVAAQQRVAHARETGDCSGLTSIEAVIAITSWQPQQKPKPILTKRFSQSRVDEMRRTGVVPEGGARVDEILAALATDKPKELPDGNAAQG